MLQQLTLTLFTHKSLELKCQNLLSPLQINALKVS